jgi:hypothetical protein
MSIIVWCFCIYGLHTQIKRMREESCQGGRCTTKLQRILGWTIAVAVASCDSPCNTFVVILWDDGEDSHGWKD